MIKFLNSSEEKPLKVFREYYKKASNMNQRNIEAISVSSYNPAKGIVDSRYVNLKFIDGNKFIFFTNYLSPKSQQFNDHKQISALIFWNTIETQIRIKADIKKTSSDFNDRYFLSRSAEKNALAISSNQSEQIVNYQKVVDNFEQTLKNDNTERCPAYWGGYEFEPHEFEFWEGHKNRLNKRTLYTLREEKWSKVFLQP